MSKLDDLKAASSLTDFAALLQTRTKTLISVLYKVPEANWYKTFPVQKKNGGERIIHAPMGKMKTYQRVLANILYECDAENKKEGMPPLSHAYRKGQSIMTNASLHKNRRYVLNLDLQDFFPSITFPRVRGYFIKDQSFGLKPECATILAQIACFEGALPQGSPCSPIVSDLVTRILDQRLARFAKQHRVTYSRYADDITFSTNAKAFPEALATGGKNPDDPWVLSTPLVEKIEGSGFSINHEKTRMQVEASRQMVTGLTVNKKVNIPQRYWGRVRSMCQSLYKTGSYYRPGADPGNPASMKTTLNSLRGVLGHVYHVKSKSHVRPVAEPGSQKKAPLIFGQKTHEDFYFYEYFVALQQPLIITEGRTDPVFLRNAIRRLTAVHGKLGQPTATGFAYRTKFFNYENTVTTLLRLGGSDPLKNLATTYEKRLARYDYKPMLHPVIILLDNDAGLAPFTSAVKRNFGRVIDLNTTDPFYHLTANLYVVKTPEPGSSGHSCIETLLGADFPNLMAGKVFPGPKEDFDASKHISKSDFAKKIVAKNAVTIDWSGYDPLLQRLYEVISHYKAPASPLQVVAAAST
ncbi:RNA-directed DNA polymerase [Brevundimonas vesicularis]|uniref:retron Ec67 family RNA-directed DNA polymerase/endonuclease n=1 Tax=Brevundimonas vesicularis TaxID=41276 RepID=UPI002786DE84|nr:retron Ec67 family RNA-directed DNA polymerase/endonuclease [Brevundimonas vesicularis]MDQ1193805.1 RNA-directed DNA polymerase [Brevundimonas vesicularis]